MCFSLFLDLGVEYLSQSSKAMQEIVFVIGLKLHSLQTTCQVNSFGQNSRRYLAFWLSSAC